MQSAHNCDAFGLVLALFTSHYLMNPFFIEERQYLGPEDKTFYFHSISVSVPTGVAIACLQKSNMKSLCSLTIFSRGLVAIFKMNIFME